MKIALERKIQIAFFFVLLLLLTIGFFGYKSAAELKEALEKENQTHGVLFELRETLHLVTSAESVARGYVITGNDEFSEQYRTIEPKIAPALAQLQNFVADNPKQTEEFFQLERLIAAKVKFSNQIVAVRRAEGFEAASDVINRLEGKRLMDEIRASVGKMEEEENSLLKKREENLQKSVINTLFILFFGTAAGFVSLGLANIAIFRETGRRRAAEEELLVINKDLEARVERRTAQLSKTNDELKAQIRQREETEYRHRMALESGNLGTWTLDARTNRAEVDERSLFLFGLSDGNFDGSGEKAFSRIHKEDLPAFKRLLETSVSERKNFNVEFRVRMPDGETRWNYCTGQPGFDEKGEVTHIIGHCRDITDSKRNENILRESEQFARKIIDNLFSFVGVMTPDGVLIEANRPALQAANLKAEDVLGKHFAETYWWAFSVEAQNQLRDSIEKAATGEKIRYDATIRLAENHFIPIDFMLAPLFDDAGKITHLIPSGLDLTPRQKVEREREELLKREQDARREAEIANRLRDEFLATVSHELRAPLNSILGWARMLEKGRLDEKTSEKAIGTIVRNAESQNRLIEDLLDVSRIISGKLRLEVMTIKPINVVEQALETVRPAAEAKGIKIEIKENKDVSHISGDPNRLQQVIWNLLSNAIKFTPNEGQVVLEIERTEDFVEIRVKDTGVGIKEEFLPHVFDRFTQADASSIRKFGGLGLGLAIVRHITEMHGGTVRAFSAGENKGSTFVVRLPVVASPKESDETENKHANAPSEPAISLDGLLILVVDDEEDTRQLLVQSLTLYGATVLSAQSAAEGLTALEEKQPDVLVSDIGMPDEDGYSLIRKIRALGNSKSARVPAIALTAFTRAQDRMRALSAGYQSHVAKPVEPDELAIVIASLTGRLQIKETENL